MPKFSIVIPVYNVSDYLSECIDSILGQSYEDYEMILINDGSTDKSGAICDAYALQDARIRVLHQANGGLSSARNAGISKASGEYIIFLDSDDLWNDGNVLKVLSDRLENVKADVLSFNYVKFTETTEYAPYFSQETMSPDVGDSFRYMAEHGLWIACAWNKVIKRKLFDNGELLFIEGITSEDMDWCVRLALKAERFDYLNRIVVRYRQRSTSISNRVSAQKVVTVLDNIVQCLNLLDSSTSTRTAHLKDYIGYQYGTMLFHLATLPKDEISKDLLERAREFKYLLKWSDNAKMKLLNMVASLGGLRLTLFLLRFKIR